MAIVLIHISRYSSGGRLAKMNMTQQKVTKCKGKIKLLFTFNTAAFNWPTTPGNGPIVELRYVQVRAELCNLHLTTPMHTIYGEFTTTKNRARGLGRRGQPIATFIFVFSPSTRSILLLVRLG